jgi:uncharacterized SAM-binding protein YcdF (DUF218 family)
MRLIALGKGVPESAIRIDQKGVSTRATATQVMGMLQPRSRVLAVSHGYHLARVKLAFRQEGHEVYTVPAEETRTLSALPYFVAREVVALWAYWGINFQG